VSGDQSAEAACDPRWRAFRSHLLATEPRSRERSPRARSPVSWNTDDPPLRVFLKRFYDAALDIYLAGEGGARGCYSIGTAATEATVDPNVRAFLADSTRNTDAFLKSRIDKARERGEIAQDADTTALAYLATATMHTIAIRSRAGLAREELDAIVDAAIAVICG